MTKTKASDEIPSGELQDACEGQNAHVGLLGLWCRVHPRWAVAVLVALAYPVAVPVKSDHHSRALYQTIPGAQQQEVFFQEFCHQAFVPVGQEMPRGGGECLQGGLVDHSRSAEGLCYHIDYAQLQVADP